MKLSRLMPAAIFLLALTLLFSCSQGDSSKLRIAFVTNNSADFWAIAEKGTQKADEELADVEVEFRRPSDSSAAEQKRVLEDLVSKGIDAIAVSPVDPANQTQLLNELANQVVVITQDSDAPQSNRACYLGTDNIAAGRQAGEMIKEALPNGGKIMIFVGKLDVRNAQERRDGIIEAIKGTKIEIIDVRTDDGDPVRAKSNVSDTLVKHPDISALIGLWSYNGPAILSAVKDADKAGKVKIIAFDEEDGTLAGIKEGAIYATVVQQPYEFGYQSIQMLAKALKGDKSVFPATKQIIVPTLIIKKDGIDAFISKINKLRGRT